VRLIIPVGVLLLLSACAPPKYLRPEAPGHGASASVHGSKSRLLDATVKTLVADGYQITAVDNAAGLVSTAARATPVTPAQADCGRVRGLLASADPLTYPHPNTRVAFNILAEDHHIEVRSMIEDHIDSATMPDDLVCTSRGLLEQALLEEIKARL
jgi:hypothetical protein